MPKCDFNKVVYNFIEIALRHGCSPVNLLHIFRTPFLRNTTGWLFLYYPIPFSLVPKNSRNEGQPVNRHFNIKHINKRCPLNSMASLNH